MRANTDDQGFVIDDTSIAPGVVETIISLAAAEVPGVAGIGAAGPLSSILSNFSAGKALPTTGIKLNIGEDQRAAVEVTIQVYYGYRLAEVADNVRRAIAEAVAAQIGPEVSSVDIYVDELKFEGHDL